MGGRSRIEWTDATWTPIRARNKATGKVGHYCVHVSEGCRNCYAERMQARFNNPIRYAAQECLGVTAGGFPRHPLMLGYDDGLAARAPYAGRP